MDMKGLAVVMEKAAPVLASYLTGPVGGMVVSLLCSSYGVENKFDLQSLASEILNNPYKLKELEISHREHVVDGLMGLLEKIENRASSAFLWVSGMIVLFGLLVFVVGDFFGLF